MTAQTLLEELKAVTEYATKDLILPTARQNDPEGPARRAPAVYIPRVPDAKQATRKVPYVLHMVESCHDWQEPGDRIPQAQIVVRSILTVWAENEMVGLFYLYNLYETIRVELLKHPIVGRQFELDLGNDGGLHFTPYTELTYPYFAGEMITVWRVPGIGRELRFERKTDPRKKCEGEGIHVEYGM